MTSRRLIVLAVLALAAIAAALLLTRQPSAPQGVATELLYPMLEAELSSVTGVKIHKPGDVVAVELARKGDTWTVNERAGYDADAAKVNRLLRALAKAKQVEQKTSNPASYGTIGVLDIGDPQATGARVELLGTPSSVNLIVGKNGPGAQSAYVRRAGEPASWLVNETIDAQPAPDAWLRKEVINVAADRVQSARVTIGTGKPYGAAKKSRTDADFSVDALPQDKEQRKELSSASAAAGFATALTAVMLADVRAAKDFEADKPAAQATFKTFDGLVADLDGWVKDGKHYIAIRAGHDAALEKQFHVETAPPAQKTGAAEGSPPPAPAATPVDTAAEAQTLTAKLTGWVYEIPDYKYEAIFKPLDELLKK